MSDNNSHVILDFLIDNGHINKDQYEAIVGFSKENKTDIITSIRESGHIANPEDITAIIANEMGLEYVKLDQIEIDRDALIHLDQRSAMRMKVLPYLFEDGALHVVAPIDIAKSVQLKNDLRKLTKVGVINVAVANRKDIIRYIETLYRNDSEMERLIQAEANSASDDSSTEDLMPEELGGESSVIKFVDLVLTQGVKDKASDIHFDPQEHGLVVRYRIDGILQAITQAPSEIITEIVSRIKILSNLDISNTRTPQDGRLEYSVNQRPIDFRVATLPSIFGEKVVMRILDNSSAQLALTDLGFTEYNLKRFRSAAHKPYGMLLVTGPTGSGKSTTLYAALNEINKPEINIITAEDPVEYQLKGITQIPVKAPMTFEKVLRTVLRADPDVILIGEIRDKETADISMKAGMTGHMVFSTLHTNDAAAALTRLGDMGVEPFITGSTVEGIVSQRLVRRLCAKCKQSHIPLEAELEGSGFNMALWEEQADGDKFDWYKPVGCRTCGQTGYKGRLAIHEVLLMTSTLEEAVIRGAKALELSRLAVDDGMITLRDDGLFKAARGLTTLQEIVRVVA
jgi:type IV pilus assembly protein PilB